ATRAAHEVSGRRDPRSRARSKRLMLGIIMHHRRTGIAGALAAIAIALLVASESRGDDAAPSVIDIGVARVDITPDYPIRLSGFGGRRAESEGVTQRIYAKALAIGSDAQSPAVLVTVDSTGVPDALTEAVAQALRAKANIARDRFVLSVT